MEQVETQKEEAPMTWEMGEEEVIKKAIDLIEKELAPYVFNDGYDGHKKSQYGVASYGHIPYTHKDYLTALPLFQKRRDLLIALGQADESKDGFYKSRKWLLLRYKVLTQNKAVCHCCGKTGFGVVLHVDHIKPRSKYPELELEQSNLQVLCEDCNMGKSNVDETDWRKEA